MQVETALLFETPEEMGRRVYRNLRPTGPVPPVSVQFCAFANANSTIRQQEAGIAVRITDLLEDAPAYVLEALLHILLAKLLRRTVSQEAQLRYRRYLLSAEVRHRLTALRQERGRKLLLPAQGRQYDVAALFEDLNQQYFKGQLAPPALGWSPRRSRRTLGHYDPSHHAIVLSRLLDDPAVPEVVVRFVLFHEMLHIQFPVEVRQGRRCVHTAAFQAAERTFAEWSEAQRLLKRLF